ncbi:unnamed protein product [Symbiodinium natans]|uniref:Uncharacterized protein n=1 Tax=Symbiodinium natans TaxID=878477 RepID=A0A812KUC3_9DINO|nr:unnamed protein product [Symbiodinium natans]
MITTDASRTPAIEIGVDPSASSDNLVIPDELRAENLIFSTVGKPTSGSPELDFEVAEED